MKYTQRPPTVEAEQLPPQGTPISAAIRAFLDRNTTSPVERGDETVSIQTFAGEIIAQRGDWIIDYGGGILDVLSPEDFDAAFERAPNN